MSLLDHITDVIKKIVPEKSSKPSASMSGGIGSGHGMVPCDDEVSGPSICFVFSTFYCPIVRFSFSNVGLGLLLTLLPSLESLKPVHLFT